MSLVEVLVAFAILAIVMAGTTSTVISSLRLIAASRAVTVASGLATASMEDALGQPFADTEDEVDTPEPPQTISVDGVAYDVTRTVRWLDADAVSGPCAGTGGASDTNVLAVEVSVDWVGRDRDPPVVQNTTIAPPIGRYDPNDGQIAIEVNDAQDPSQPVAGVTVRVFDAGGLAVATATTNLNGCVVFGALDPDTYEVAVSRPGFVDIDQRRDPDVVATVGVAPGTRATHEFRYAEEEQLELALAGNFGGAVPADPLQLHVVNNIGDYEVGYGGPGSTIIDLWPDSYQAYAGGCDPADPEGTDGGGSPTWPAGASRGPFADTDLLSPGVATALLGTAALDWTVDWPTPAEAVELVAVSQDVCDGPADTNVTLGPATTGTPVDYALPFGEWRIDVVAGSTVVGRSVGNVTLDPTATAATAGTLAPLPACSPGTPAFLGVGAEFLTESALGDATLPLETAAAPGDTHVIVLYAADAASRRPTGWTLLTVHDSGAVDLAVFTKQDSDDVDVLLPGGPGPTAVHSFAVSNVDGGMVGDLFAEAYPAPASGDDDVILDRGVTVTEPGALVLLAAGGNRASGSTLGSPTLSPAPTPTLRESTYSGSSRYNVATFVSGTSASGTTPAWTVEWGIGATVNNQAAVVWTFEPGCWP